MEPIDRKDLFDGFDPAEHEEEVRRRWGDTDAYRESARRTQRYTRADWERLKAEGDAVYRDAAAAQAAGQPADSVAVMDIAERHRLAIDRWFYPCGEALHVELAAGYEADERFARSIDRFGERLTPFLCAAIRANARRD